MSVLTLEQKAERLAAIWIARRANGIKALPSDVFSGWADAARDGDPPLPLTLTVDPVHWHAGWLLFHHEHQHDLDVEAAS